MLDIKKSMRDKKTLEEVNHVDDMARTSHFDPYLASLFVARPYRAGLHAIFAFSSELAHVRHAVSEEILAHIRYAWWEESLDLMKDGHSPRAQPTLEAIAPMLSSGVITREELVSIVDAYRQAYPALPDMDETMFSLSEKMVREHAPQSLPGWQKGLETIRNHRKKHGNTRNHWLLWKILFLGLFYPLYGSNRVTKPTFNIGSIP